MPENVFILNAGRCGSTTFARAARYIKNYTSGHETRTNLVGEDRLNFPKGHIEADNRLSWLLGRLDDKWGDNAYYVHLTRDRVATAESHLKRMGRGASIIRAYRRSVLLGRNKTATDLDFCLDYVDTVTSNIGLFLKDKTHVLPVTLENAKSDFEKFWDWIGAEGDKQAALDVWDVKHNRSRDKALA